LKYIKRYVPQAVYTWVYSKEHYYSLFDDPTNELGFETFLLKKEGLIICVDTISRVSCDREFGCNEYVDIPREFFDKILHHDYTLYLLYLEYHGIIQRDGIYEVGSKSYGYKINDAYLGQPVSVNMMEPLYIKRTLKAIKSSGVNLSVTKEHKRNFLKDFKIDYNAASAYALNCYINQTKWKGKALTKQGKYLIDYKLKCIDDGQLYIFRNSTNGRVCSNLTVLNGDYKKFIVGYYQQTDIVSSQPLMLVGLLNFISSLSNGEFNSSQEGIGIFKGNKVGTNNTYTILYTYVRKMLSKRLAKSILERFLEDLKNLNLPFQKEIEKYTSVCQSGQFYELFQECFKTYLGLSKSREEVKENIFKILFAANQTRDPNTIQYRKVFEKEFPSIYKWIKSIKSLVKNKKVRKPHAVFSLLLQLLESFIWIERILPELDKMNMPYHFIHDSVLLKTKSDLERVEWKILEQFNYLKLTPRFKSGKIK
jgi:hypothetical protein